MKLSHLFRAVCGILLAAFAPSAFADAPVSQIVSPSVTVTFPARPEHIGTGALYIAKSASAKGGTIAYIASSEPGAWMGWAFSRYPDVLMDPLADNLRQKWQQGGDKGHVIDIMPVELAGGQAVHFVVDGVRAAAPKAGEKRGMLAAANFFPGQSVRFDGYFLFAKDGPALLAVATPSDTPANPALLSDFADAAKLTVIPKTTDTPDQQLESLEHWALGAVVVVLVLFILAIILIVKLVRRLLRKRRPAPVA